MIPTKRKKRFLGRFRRLSLFKASGSSRKKEQHQLLSPVSVLRFPPEEPSSPRVSTSPVPVTINEAPQELHSSGDGLFVSELPTWNVENMYPNAEDPVAGETPLRNSFEAPKSVSSVNIVPNNSLTGGPTGSPFDENQRTAASVRVASAGNSGTRLAEEEDTVPQKGLEQLGNTTSHAPPEPVLIVAEPQPNNNSTHAVTHVATSGSNQDVPYVGRQVRIIRHGDKQYVGRVGCITNKKLRKGTFEVAVPGLESVNKQLKTLEFVHTGGTPPSSEETNVTKHTVLPPEGSKPDANTTAENGDRAADTGVNEAPTAESSPSSTFHGPTTESVVGRHVRILRHGDKNYRGKVGRIKEEVRKGTFQVVFPDLQPVNKRLATLEFVEDQRGTPLVEMSTSESATSHMELSSHSRVSFSSKPAPFVEEQTPSAVDSGASCAVPSNPTDQLSSNELVGRRVRVLRHPSDRNYEGRVGRIACTSRRKNEFKIEFDGLAPINKQLKTLQFVDGLGEPPSHATGSGGSRRVFGGRNKKAAILLPVSRQDDDMRSAKHWRVPNSDEGGETFGLKRIVKIRTTSFETNKSDSLLSFLLQDRILIVENPFTKDELQNPIEKVVHHNGYKYELISTKLQADGDKGSGKYWKAKCLCLCYAQAEGEGLGAFSIADYLQRIADFASLDPRKAKSRLELLQSPAHTIAKAPAIFFLTSDSFSSIHDTGGNQGCGFISEELLVSMFGGGASAHRVIAVQVRILVPAMGMFKGMLFRKYGLFGRCIELPSSMKKVEASKHPDAFDGGLVLICRGGVHASVINSYIDRKLDPAAKPPPEKSFQQAITPLCEMIIRLWRGMGVPDDVSKAYGRRSRSPEHLSHAWLGGVADSTGWLPPGHVFVTGLHKRVSLESIFVSRSPCLEPTDGRMLPHATSKPEAMSEESWNWLLNLPFCAILFGEPSPGMKSLPESVADGDLDGDRYFVCWDQMVLSHVKAIPFIETPTASEQSSVPKWSTGDERRGEDGDDWLGNAQRVMLDSVESEKTEALVGILYKLQGKVADKSPMFNRDPDSIALSRAYKDALDHSKHGGKISLPAHLRAMLPPSLQTRISLSEREPAP